MAIVGVIGAMEEEVLILRDKLLHLQETKIAGSWFYKGSVSGTDVVLLKSGIGKVNAAMGTTLLNQVFHPDYVVNTGSAGGIDPSLNVGDVVISTEVRHHDADSTAFGYEYGQVPDSPPYYAPSDKLVEIAFQSAAELTGIQVVKGLIASGDSFMNQPARIEFVKSKFPRLLAVEMEAAAIGQVCYHYEKPFVIIRALSDIAGKESPTTFEQFLATAAKHSAEVVLGIINRLKE